MGGQNTNRNAKGLMIGILMSILFLPFSQRHIFHFDFQPLKGWHAITVMPNITSNAWLSGTYQSNFDKYTADSFGFTPPLVRSVNQLDYALFNTANAQFVTIGKEHYLYETAYIDAAYGLDFLGNDSIEHQCKRLAEIQSKLQNMGKKLLVVFAPGKGSYFPEFIPDYYHKYRKESTNYAAFKAAFKSHQINYLDFNAWFRAMKDTATYHLFPQTGIHWSTYGMAVAGDSLAKYLTRTSGLQLPQYHIESGEISTIMRKSDSDVEDGMNLWSTLPHLPMMYPKISFKPGQQKLKTAVIADSYFWGLYDHGFSSQFSDSGEFWYYFNDVYPQNIKVDEMDLKEAILKQDVIIILATDATLPRFGWGFIEHASKLF